MCRYAARELEERSFAWLKRTVFGPRAIKESECRSFFDSPTVWKVALDKDWDNAHKQPSFAALLGPCLVT